MRNAFVYVVGWKQIGKYYAGVRYRAGCQPSDLWTLYFTSSKLVADFRIQHGEPDVVRVVKTFGDDALEARLFEQRYLRKVNALHSDKWLNRAVGGHFAGRRGPHSEETKMKIAAKAKGRKRKTPVSEEQKQKQRETFKRNYEANRAERFATRSAKQKGRIITEEHRAKISSTLTGTTLPEEVKRKISAASKLQSRESRQKQAEAIRKKKWFTNGVLTVREEVCPGGYRPGRKMTDSINLE